MQTLKEAFDFVGVKTEDILEPIWSSLEPFGVYFSTPAIVLTCISSRVVLIWLLNLIGGMFCLSLSHVLANQNAENNRPKPVPASEVSPRQHTPQPALVYAPEQVQQPSAPPATVTPQFAPLEPQYSEQIRPKPVPFIIPAQNAELDRQDSRYQPNERTALQSPVMLLPPPPSRQEQLQQQQQQQLSPQPDITTYRTTDAHPDQLNYPANAEPISARPTSPAVQQLATASALNSRYSELYPAQPANPRVSEELRNQMPWSYTSMITKPPPPPRKPQQQVQIYPQIPEPDYAEQ